MTKSILVSLAVLTLSTSAALAATHHRHAIHHRAMNANASAGASPVVWMGGVSSSDRDMYIRNLRDSGYDKKQDFNSNGTIRVQ